MSIVVVGSVAFDTIETPYGKVKNAIGGSSIYFSLSASYFTPIKLVAVIGTDFPEKFCKLLEKHNINLLGLKRIKGKTFSWEGRYCNDLNRAETIRTNLNVLNKFLPELPKQYRKTKYVFLGNIDPKLQLKVITQITDPELVLCDTMNYWIETQKENLLKVLKKVDIIVINESEAKQLAQENNIIKAGKKIISLGPKSIVIKRGEYGVFYMNDNTILSIPAYPVENVKDPTGAGDSFAGGFMGYLIKSINENKNKNKLNIRNIFNALIYGSIMGSFCVENFSVKSFIKLNYSQINRRYNEYIKIIGLNLK